MPIFVATDIMSRPAAFFSVFSLPSILDPVEFFAAALGNNKLFIVV